MSKVSLKDIGELGDLVDGLALNKVQATKLNRIASNAMRRILAKNIRDQKDIHGRPFTPRKKLKLSIRNNKIKKTGKMFQKVARLSVVESDDKNAYLGFNSKMARIVDVHNMGGVLSFKRSSGKMVIQEIPKREFFGWSDEMVREVRESIINEYSKMQGVN
jgi:phage virion morphogenesis protein